MGAAASALPFFKQTVTTMRKIKFRGKDIETGKWIYGDLIQRIGYMPSIIYAYEHNGKICYGECAVKRETVGQFTGRLDKNGNEIYEGDIVKSKYTKRAPVKYKDVHFCVDYNGFQGLLGSEDYEVIGNVHEDNDEVTYEMCPHCGNEVVLKAELSVQKCPSCGKYIVCCSMCDECLQDCPYEEEAKRLNEKGGKQ